MQDFFGYFCMMFWMFFKVTNVTNDHLKQPKIGKNRIENTYQQKGQKKGLALHRSQKKALLVHIKQGLFENIPCKWRFYFLRAMPLNLIKCPLLKKGPFSTYTVIFVHSMPTKIYKYQMHLKGMALLNQFKCTQKVFVAFS